MFTTIRSSRTSLTTIIVAGAIAVAALVGELLFLEREVAEPFTSAVAAMQPARPQLVEEITVRAPAPATHFVNVR